MFQPVTIFGFTLPLVSVILIGCSSALLTESHVKLSSSFSSLPGITKTVPRKVPFPSKTSILCR